MIGLSKKLRDHNMLNNNVILLDDAKAHHTAKTKIMG
jgi:hypothetical protein